MDRVREMTEDLQARDALIEEIRSIEQAIRKDANAVVSGRMGLRDRLIAEATERIEKVLAFSSIPWDILLWGMMLGLPGAWEHPLTPLLWMEAGGNFDRIRELGPLGITRGELLGGILCLSDPEAYGLRSRLTSPDSWSNNRLQESLDSVLEEYLPIATWLVEGIGKERSKPLLIGSGSIHLPVHSCKVLSISKGAAVEKP